MVNTTNIPTFLSEFLSFYEGNLNAVRPVSYTFFFEAEEKLETNHHSFQTAFFKDFYKIAKESLNLKFRGTITERIDEVKVAFYMENEFLSYQIQDKEIIQIPLLFDMPVYWFNEGTSELGASLMPGAVSIEFLSYPDTAIYMHFEFHLFSNHIIRVHPYHDTNRDKYYFEPAAKKNRALIRNFALCIKEKYPSLVVDFCPERSRVYPRDEFGFLEGADLI